MLIEQVGPKCNDNVVVTARKEDTDMVWKAMRQEARLQHPRGAVRLEA